MAKVLEENDSVTAAYEEALNKFGHRPYVTAIDVGPKYIDGKKTGQMAVRIHVAEKKDKSVLEAADVFPEQIRGVEIDVIQGRYSSENAALQFITAGTETSDRTRRHGTLRPGISVAHQDSTAGTLGMFVKDNKSGKPAILSNWHVLAGSGSARPGDRIVQPGPYDGGKLQADTVATLERMILDRDGDAAIALLTQARPYATAMLDTDHQVRSIAKPERGDVVIKSGRTTGVTRGVVEGTGTYFINYSVGRIGVQGMIIVPEDKANPRNVEISMGGDSGSIWIDEKTGSAVGLHFAGETDPLPGEEHAIACDITRVFERLDISLLPASERDEAGAADQPTVKLLADEMGALASSAVFEQLDGREIRRIAAALSARYPRLADSDEVNRTMVDLAAPEIGPFGAVAVGFAAGAAARLIGRESLQSCAPEAFPVVVTAFLAGAAAGARAVDGKL